MVHLTWVLVALGVATAAAVLLLVAQRSVPLAATFGVLIGAVFALATAATFRPFHEKYRRDVRARRARREELRQRLESLLCDGCAEEDRLAAAYDGWYGSVHTFYFSSQEFTSLVRHANAGKCLR